VLNQGKETNILVAPRTHLYADAVWCTSSKCSMIKQPME